MRRAYLAPEDGKASEFGLYGPPDCDPAKKRFIVALHGMNGHSMQMLMWLFGHDDPMHDGNWEDRHPRRELEHLEAIVVAPDGRPQSRCTATSARRTSCTCSTGRWRATPSTRRG